jgi:DNA recombination protein RmuC
MKVGAVQSSVDQRLDANRRDLNERLDAVDARMGNSLTNTQETIGRIGEQLGVLGQSAERILEVGKDVSSLKDVLQPPKLRGAFGEMLLEQLLKQVLPAAHYETQYRFSDGTAVDAVIRTPDGLVPVDSKFPIDSYRRLLEAPTEDERGRLRRAFMRDVRNRVDEVAKYIRPGERTMDFAFMYVPSEGIFYEVIAGANEEDSLLFANERQVQLVSPNTFYAFLQVVARGLQRMQVQEDVKEFMGRLAQVKREFGRFRVEFDKLGGHLSHAKSKYDELDKQAVKIDSRLNIAVDESYQAPLPDPQAAPAPLLEPVITNGGNEPH